MDKKPNPNLKPVDYTNVVNISQYINFDKILLCINFHHLILLTSTKNVKGAIGLKQVWNELQTLEKDREEINKKVAGFIKELGYE